MKVTTKQRISAHDDVQGKEMEEVFTRARERPPCIGVFLNWNKKGAAMRRGEELSSGQCF